MTKLTLDMSTFKALASDTRLDILRALDGKKLNLKELGKVTSLNKATLHEHLTKLNEAGLVKKKERDGHKWVYYKLTWKGEGLLHPENTRIVVMFSATFIALAAGILQMFNFLKGQVVARAVNFAGSDSTVIIPDIAEGGVRNFSDELLKIGDDAVSSSFYTQAPVSVSFVNQTTQVLSQELVDSVDIKGIVGNSIPDSSVVWSAEPGAAFGYINETFRFNMGHNWSSGFGLECHDGDAVSNIVSGNGVAESAGNIPSSMVAVVHDPALQAIAIVCIAVACVILSFAIWRYWKNRTPKL